MKMPICSNRRYLYAHIHNTYMHTYTYIQGRKREPVAIDDTYMHTYTILICIHVHTYTEENANM